MTITESIIQLSYFIAVILFIVGMKLMNHPVSAKKGNFVAAMGMLLAIVVTFLEDGVGNIILILVAMGIGTIGGVVSAKKVEMTAMPEMVSFFNGMGGASAALIALIEYCAISVNLNGEVIDTAGNVIPGGFLSGYVITIIVSLFIGGISFSGSLVAMGKLEGFIDGKSRKLPMHMLVSILFFAGIVALGAVITLENSANEGLIWLLFVLSFIFGLIFVFPIGGGDMPVVISLLNSFTGVTAATTGLLYDNKVMLMGGILVGSAGIILTILMCSAMNTTLTALILNAFKNAKPTSDESSDENLTVKEISSYDSAILMNYAKRVVIVPGYGLAVAQAQHITHELEKTLEEKGVDVKYGIHPVAGRMPGHMNVLLAESDVPYEKLVEMDDINPELPNTDVVLIVGANDVVNPAAEEDPKSSIYGMPIIRANQAKNVIVIKRSMGAGYAGIQNKLFFDEKTRMLFGDAKKVLTTLTNEIKNM